MADDPWDLDRFVRAQDGGGSYDRALAELRRGRKTSHWMWYVLPQVRGLGHSPTAQAYGISGLDEAQAYLAHPVLGPRLHESMTALLDLPETATATGVLGQVDAMKLRSSMTLFLRAAPADPQPAAVLARFFDGEPDAATDRILSAR